MNKKVFNQVIHRAIQRHIVQVYLVIISEWTTQSKFQMNLQLINLRKLRLLVMFRKI